MATHRLVGAVVVMTTVVLIVLGWTAASAAGGDRRSSSSSSSTRSRSSSARGNRGRGHAGNVVQTRRQDIELPYYWMCPVVHCTPVPSDCQTVEFMVFEQEYDVPGQGLVNVRCQSCDYCLDVPREFFTNRGTRGFDDARLLTPKQTVPCPAFRCPSIHESCEDIRLTNVLLSGRVCDQCPACYDRTIFGAL